MALDSSKAPSHAVRVLSRALDLLDELQRSPEGLRLREVARAAGVPRSTASRYLATLEERRYVDRDPTSGLYRLGLGVPSQAQFFARLRVAVRPSLERLREKFDETITFSMLDGHRTTLLEIAQSHQPIRLGAEVGKRDYLHSTAMGKAIAASLPEDFVRDIIGTVGLPALTPDTITDPDRYLAELKEIRARGYAVSSQENNVGTYGVAVAVPTTRLPAGIGLSAPSIRFERDAVPGIVESLCKEAELIATALESRPR
jgi:IclR family acetate operon transcriptional repressor